MTFITLAKVNPGNWEKLSKGLPKECYEVVKKTYVVYGQYDLVILWEAPDFEKANRVVKHFAEIGAFSSETLLVASSLEEFGELRHPKEGQLYY